MAFEWGPRHVESYPAASDLSANQYCVVQLNTSGTIQLAGAGGGTGILDNAPKQNQTAAMVDDGTTKVLLGGTVAIGTPLVSNSSGLAVAYTTGSANVFGIARQAGVSGQIISASVDFSGAATH